MGPTPAGTSDDAYADAGDADTAEAVSGVAGVEAGLEDGAPGAFDGMDGSEDGCWYVMVIAERCGQVRARVHNERRYATSCR